MFQTLKHVHTHGVLSAEYLRIVTARSRTAGNLALLRLLARIGKCKCQMAEVLFPEQVCVMLTHVLPEPSVGTLATEKQCCTLCSECPVAWRRSCTRNAMTCPDAVPGWVSRLQVANLPSWPLAHDEIVEGWISRTAEHLVRADRARHHHAPCRQSSAST